MKLDDILEETNKRVAHGQYAVVYKDTKDAHLVAKASIFQRDAYYFYAKTVLDQKLWLKTVHLPRIYGVVEKRGKYDVKMERLIDLSAARPSEIHAMARHLFHSDKGLEKDIYAQVETPARLAYITERYIMDYPIAAFFMHEKSIQASRQLKITRSVLIGVMNHLRKLAHGAAVEYDGVVDDEIQFHNGRMPMWDMHTGNMMMRRTPTGPQLVITDPFA